MNINRVLGFTAIGLFSNAVLMVVSFIFIRSSSSDVSGSFFYYVTVSSFLVNLAFFGNATYLNKVFSDFEKKDVSLLLSSVKVFVLLFFFLSILTIIASKDDLYIVVFVFILLEMGLIKSYRERIFCSYTRVHGSSKDYAKIQVWYVFSKLLVTICYSNNYFSFDILIISYFLTSLPVFYQTRYFVKDILYSNEYIKFVSYFKNGLPFFAATIFTMGYDYAPILSLKLISNDLEGIGIFGSTYKLTSIIVISLGILSQSLLPYFRGLFNKRSQKHVVYSGILILLFVLFLYLPFYFILDYYAYDVILYTIGIEYISGTTAFQYQLLGIWGSICNFIIFTILQAIDKQKIIILIICPSALCNIFLSIIFSNEGAYGVSKALCYSLNLCAFLSFAVLINQLRLSYDKKI